MYRFNVVAYGCFGLNDLRISQATAFGGMTIDNKYLIESPVSANGVRAFVPHVAGPGRPAKSYRLSVDGIFDCTTESTGQ
jgi:hypothetical protein